MGSIDGPECAHGHNAFDPRPCPQCEAPQKSGSGIRDDEGKNRLELIQGEAAPTTPSISPEQYAKFVAHGNFTKSRRDAQFLIGMGLAGEGGEVCDLLKKHLLHGKELDLQALILELGDVLWYLTAACNQYRISLDEIRVANVVKLCDRYLERNGSPSRWLGRGV